MEALLFLAHRLPYPPHKGDKVRSHAFLKHLAARYRVFLGAFIDEASDWQHVPQLERLCTGVRVEPIVPWRNRALSLRTLLTGEAASLAYFRSAPLRRWVREIVNREKITRAFIFSSPMAQYALDLPLRLFVDFVDVDSAKWADYAARRPWPAAALYRREARKLRGYEKAIAERAEASILVTDEERRRFLAQMPGCTRPVVTIRNGVDAGYFSPAHHFDTPFAGDEQAIVFVGAMDYWPNIDAAVWFAREVLPLVRTRQPARFYVVGMNPSSAVRALARDPAVTVTGRVEDVRPYLRHASVVVAPLRVARGIQNKVLEAMAMAKAVVTTPACAAALGAQPGVELEVASDEAGLAFAVLAALNRERAQRMGELARAWVLARHAWPASLRALEQLLEPAPRQAPRALAQ